ncbi:MAG: hypothetical protein PWQ59_1373 [Thermoanaerobacterium sp.]|nr:hypothetical protein [Thermoanaerobacterium sp.]MDI3529471.1 hypothetical protein [Thermoanaerobacter sp.]
MPHFAVTYDINDFYQAVTDLLYSFWPIIAVVLGIALATLVIEGIVIIVRKFNE